MSVYVHTSKTQREMGTMVNGCVWMLYIPGGKKDTNKRHKGGRLLLPYQLESSIQMYLYQKFRGWRNSVKLDPSRNCEQFIEVVTS